VLLLIPLAILLTPLAIILTLMMNLLGLALTGRIPLAIILTTVEGKVEEAVIFLYITLQI
jgi:hypothetical protein